MAFDKIVCDSTEKESNKSPLGQVTDSFIG